MKKLISLAVTSLLLFMFGFVFTNRQEIFDWWLLRDYVPSERVLSLATATTMNQEGKKLFYVNDPQIQDKTTFRQNCTSSEVTIVLGCYVSGDGIYIFDVNDERLSGVHEVTAAHEMLHAAYERLDDDERKKIDALITSAYAGLNDDRVKQTIKEYEKRDPSIVSNELHSILGTEVENLASDLEEYYKKYFDDRQKIVRLAKKYEAEFTLREEKVSQYDVTLAEKKQTIEQLENVVESQNEELEIKKNLLEQLRQSDPETYNQEVPSYNALVKLYNSNIKNLRLQIDLYNQLVQERNDIVSEEQELMNALDTRVYQER